MSLLGLRYRTAAPRSILILCSTLFLFSHYDGHLMAAAAGQPISNADSAAIVPVELGQPPGCVEFVPVAMNNGAFPYDLTIVGAANCELHAVPFSWHGGTWSEYGVPELDPRVAVTAISVSDGTSRVATVTFVVGEMEFDQMAWVRTGQQPAAALPAFNGMSHASWAVVSSEGNSLAGTIGSDTVRAVRWKQAGNGWSLPEEIGPGFAVAINANGDTVLGNLVQGTPWVWTGTSQGGELVLLDDHASARDISQGGTIVVGTREIPDGSGSGVLPAPAYWSLQDGIWQLHDLQMPIWTAAGSPAWAMAVAEVDGRAVIVGNIDPGTGATARAVAWLPGADGSYGPPIALESLDDSPSGRSEVVDINRNGTAVGSSSVSGDSMASTAVIWQVVEPPQLPINVGHAGAWYNPATPGQGLLIDIEPIAQSMFVAWFTYTGSASGTPGEQHWYTAQGHYSGATAGLGLNETLGGKFDDPQATTTERVGRIGLSFSDCNQVLFGYEIDTDGRDGAMYLQRVIPESTEVCTQQTADPSRVESVNINAGMNGAWVNQNAQGQGFLIDAHTKPDGTNFILVAWFTYGDGSMSGQRWLTAQGDFSGSLAELPVYETTGGRFDEIQHTETHQVGLMNIDFTDCSNAWLSYSLDDDTAAGASAITRLAPGGQALCEALSAPQ